MLKGGMADSGHPSFGLIKTQRGEGKHGKIQPAAEAVRLSGQMQQGEDTPGTQGHDSPGGQQPQRGEAETVDVQP